MKKITLLIILMIATVVAAGCSGGDASYSPDPTVGGAADGGDTTGGDGGTGDQPSGGDEEKTDTERDCFLDGFCYRECVVASECPDGFSCVMHVCTFDCQTDSECGSGGVCNDMGLCEASSGEGMPPCTTHEECGEGRFCNSMQECEAISVLLGCQSDVDCPSGQYCNATHSCELFPVAGVSCLSDTDCPGDYYCGAGSQCLQDCRTDYQCAAGQACDGAGRCVVPGAPAKLVWFNFGAAGADTDPSGPVVFESPSFMVTDVVITPAGRSQTLTSTSFRLTGSMNY